MSCTAVTKLTANFFKYCFYVTSQNAFLSNTPCGFPVIINFIPAGTHVFCGIPVSSIHMQISAEESAVWSNNDYSTRLSDDTKFGLQPLWPCRWSNSVLKIGFFGCFNRKTTPLITALAITTPKAVHDKLLLLKCSLITTHFSNSLFVDCRTTTRLATAMRSGVSIRGRLCKNFPHV